MKGELAVINANTSFTCIVSHSSVDTYIMINQYEYTEYNKPLLSEDSSYVVPSNT